MNQHTTPIGTARATELEAFCPTRPPAEEVTGQLEQLGYQLVFSMPAQRGHGDLPPLPAQYHYRHPSGAEAIYLEGRDSPSYTDKIYLPPHESRFWLSRGGSDAEAFQLAQSTLALCWGFQWQEARDDNEGADTTAEVA